MNLISTAFSGRPAYDMALSHAVLLGVARCMLPPTARLYRPGPTLAFGRLDVRSHGFSRASARALEHGFRPVVRVTGGRAAAYDERSLIYEEACPTSDHLAGVQARYAAASTLVCDALRAVGANARVGEVPGEYCPGDYSVSIDGRVKVAGIAQRAIRGATLVSTVIVVGGGDAIRSVLRDVNDALGFEWDIPTAGALDEEVPGAAVTDVEQELTTHLARRGGLVATDFAEPTLLEAERLEERHAG